MELVADKRIMPYLTMVGCIRLRFTVRHSQKEWACDDNGDGVREVRVNGNESGWMGLCNFLRPFAGSICN